MITLSYFPFEALNRDGHVLYTYSVHTHNQSTIQDLFLPLSLRWLWWSRKHIRIWQRIIVLTLLPSCSSRLPPPSSCNKRYPFSLQCWFKRFSRIIKRLMYSLVWLGKGDARELIWRDFLPQQRRFEPSAPKAICADRDFGWKNIYDDNVVSFISSETTSSVRDWTISFQENCHNISLSDGGTDQLLLNLP